MSRFNDYGNGDFGFLMRFEWGVAFDYLDDDRAGKLVKMMFEYARGNDDVEADDKELNAFWEIIKWKLGD